MLNLPVHSQTDKSYQIDLKTSPFLPTDKIDQRIVNDLNDSLKRGPTTTILQFYRIPSKQQKLALSALGIRLLNYVGGYAYVVEAEKPITVSQLKKASVRSLMLIPRQLKIHLSLDVSTAKPLVVHLSLFPIVTVDHAMAILEENGYASKKVYGSYPVLEVVVPPGRLLELASFSFVEFIEPPPPPPVDLNDKSEATTKANVLQSTDYGLTGEGVVMQISEFTSYPQGHLDFIDRSILGQTQSVSNYHSTHVTGIAAGAGLIDERYKGYAPKARFISNPPFAPTESAILTYNIDLTNNSYGAGAGCSNASNPNSLNAVTIEKMAIDFPHLLNVFAAGNYAGSQCALYPVGYNTIDANNQTSKAVLTVGSVDPSGLLAAYSSKGPVYQRRLKPEIVAPGSLIWSTVPDNTYFTNSGTSMASPAAVGGLALLYQRYSQLHSGIKPDNALMKSLLCNTATDKGPVGPDYGYGFGLMNLNRAVQALDAGNFFQDSVEQDEVKTKTIAVPLGTAQLKVMLYWNDRPASPLSTKLIINDLDLLIKTPQSATILPYILDTVPSLVANPALRGVDHVNNLEQVVIEHPQAGTYSVNVKGFAITEGDLQNYYVVYDLVPDTVQLTYPSTGQTLVPGETVKVQWDNWGLQTSSLKLEFSADGGVLWQTIEASIAASANGFDWTVPQPLTTIARLRLTRNDDGKTTVSERFRILGVPSLTLNASQCPSSIAVDWTPVASATDYEVMRYKGGNMVAIATTAQTHYLLTNLSEDSTYWITVRARYKGEAGKRAVALRRKPDSGGCTDSLYDGDLKMDTLIAPLFGRRFTSKQLGHDTIKVRIKNLDDVGASNFTVGYSVNGGAWVTEVYTSSINPSSSGLYSFTEPFDFTQPGNYTIKLAVHGTGDTNITNDTIQYTVRNLANDPIGLTAPVLDDIESAPLKDYKTNVFGIDGLSRFDYTKTSSTTELLRVGSHYQQDTTRALELAYSSFTFDPPQPHSLTATYNLSLFDTALNSVALDLSYARISLSAGLLDSVLVRGSDTAKWIYVQNLNRNISTTTMRNINGIAIGDSLRFHRQNFSSSFQIKWAPDATSTTIILDNIRLYNASNDLALVSIDSLSPNNCGLSAATPVRITIQNRGRIPINNLVVKYRVDSGAVISETIALIPQQSLLSYTFTQRVDLSGIGLHSLNAWLEFPTDNYLANNSVQLAFRNLPLIKSFPFLEDFEESNSGWYAEGVNSTWQMGTPSSQRINSAASGKNSWKTNLTGNHTSNELSYLYTGCYDLSSLQKPIISISAALNTDSCGVPQTCDYSILQYSVNGIDWRNLLPAKSLYNWPNFITSFWYNRWHVMSQRLPDTLKTVQFRFQFRSNGVTNYEGIAIDDWHVYDSTAMIYEGKSNSVTQAITGGQQWVELHKDGKLLAALQPRGQDLGSVTLQTFINNSAVRNFHGQYYGNRNFVLQASNPLLDSIKLRLYFTDKEADSLLFSKNCPTCIKPANAYRFGVNTFAGADSTAFDSSIVNNTKGAWNFIANGQVKTVPFANGYYIEFNTKVVGEIRISNGGLNAQSPLPVKVMNFTANGNGAGAFLQWQTTSEINIHHFDIEVANGNAALAQNQFEKIGEVLSKGRSAFPQAYNFIHNTPGKNGVRYYRLKSLDAYGNYIYSEAIPVFFSDELTWQAYPNPSTGKFNLVYQSSPGAVLVMRIYNSVGEQLKEVQLAANGFVQTSEINLEKGGFAKGVYFLRIKDGEKIRHMKVIKQ